MSHLNFTNAQHALSSSPHIILLIKHPFFPLLFPKLEYKIINLNHNRFNHYYNNTSPALSISTHFAALLFCLLVRFFVVFFFGFVLLRFILTLDSVAGHAVWDLKSFFSLLHTLFLVHYIYDVTF